MDYDVMCVGAANLDTIAVVDVVPGSDERRTSATIVDAGGGPAGTAAVAIARLGANVAFCGVVGRDQAGDRLVELFEREGVDTRWVRRVEGAVSARSIVLAETSTAGRSIVAGIAQAPAPDDIPVDRAGWIHVDQTGYAPVMTALSTRASRALVSLDAGNPIPDLDLARVDLYAPTRASLSVRYPHLNLADAMIAAANEGPSRVVATDGSRGAYVLTAEGVRHLAAFDLPILSTIGAGDVFHGALVASLVAGLDDVAATRRASAVAALSCRALDGRSGIPDSPEVDAFLASIKPSTTEHNTKEVTL